MAPPANDSASLGISAKPAAVLATVLALRVDMRPASRKTVLEFTPPSPNPSIPVAHCACNELNAAIARPAPSTTPVNSARERPEITRIRDLYQRRKGRDLFDLWLAIAQTGAQPRDIADCFEPYRPMRWTPDLALRNLSGKLADPRFAEDLPSFLGGQRNTTLRPRLRRREVSSPIFPIERPEYRQSQLILDPDATTAWACCVVIGGSVRRGLGLGGIRRPLVTSIGSRRGAACR